MNIEFLLKQIEEHRENLNPLHQELVRIPSANTGSMRN